MHSVVQGDYSTETERKLDVNMAPQLNVVVQGKKITCPGLDLLLGAVPSMRKEGGVIRLPDERHVEALMAVVGYLSDGRMENVDVHNAAEVLDCARFLELAAVEDACEKFLIERISAMSCVKLRRLASQHRLSKLALVCDQFLSESFATVLAQQAAFELPRIQVRLDVSNHLLELGPNLLEKVVPKVLLELDSMRCDRQHQDEAVVQLVLRPDFTVSEWIKETYDGTPLSPERNTPEFYSKLRSGCTPARQLILAPKKTHSGEIKPQRMHLLATTKLTDAYSVCLVEDGSSLLLITISLCTVLHNGQLPASPTTGLPTFSHTSGCFISQMNCARSGFGIIATETEMIAIGGFNRTGCINKTECYNTITNSWKDAQCMTTYRGRLCTAQVDNKIYAIGGSDGRRELSSVETLDLKNGRWQKMGVSMPTPRSCLGAATLDGIVYAIGGEHYSIPLRTTEAFNPSTKTWQTLSPMNTVRSDLAVAVCAGKVYAIGGKAQSFKCLSSVEAYDPVRNLWSPVSSMKCARRNAVAVTVGDKIMVVGGYSGSVALRSVELYDPAQDEWTDLPPLCSIRSHASAVLYNNQVYVLGGFSGSNFLSTVECFDLQTKQWTPFA